MSGTLIKGWCPDAYRPMQSGDGWIFRIKPKMNRLSAIQALQISEIAKAYGNAQIDITRRGNLQLRGFSAINLSPALEKLKKAGLVFDEHIESARNILVSPFWQNGDLNEKLHNALLTILPQLPQLSSKFGYAIDAGDKRYFDNEAYDIRLLRGAGDKIVIELKGSETGHAYRHSDFSTLSDDLQEILRSFTNHYSSSNAHSRMKDWLITEGIPHGFMPKTKLPFAEQDFDKGAKNALDEHHIGIAFGKIHAQILHELAQYSHSIQLTPWRSIIVDWLDSPPKNLNERFPNLLTNPHDPKRHMTLCTGAPACSSAFQDTHELAQKLALFKPVDTTLHIMGCPKSCASQARFDMVITGNEQGYALKFRNKHDEEVSDNFETQPSLINKFKQIFGENHAL